MSLISNNSNISETSVLSACPETEGPSILNTNAIVSDMDSILEENSTAQTSVKLSISLDPTEVEHLKNSRGLQKRRESFLKLKNSTKTDSTSNGGDAISEEVSICESENNNITLANDETRNPNTPMDISDDSIIAVEDNDEDDETEDASTLRDSRVPAVQLVPEPNMFSHLQPNTNQDQEKIVTPTSEMKAKSPSENMESGLPHENNVENETSSIVPNESQYFKTSFLELGRRLWPSSTKSQSYTKGCFWSPDGTCLLVPVHMDGMHIMELPTDLYAAQEVNTERELSPLNSVVHVKEGGMVYDVVWYPYMNSSDPASCCWLATRKHEPIHMWDAFTGELRCSYRGYDEVDEVESAISLAFTNDGQKIIGGYKKTIKIFDTNVPGRVYTSVRVKHPASCLAFTTDNCVTAGSWNSLIYHYDLRAPKLGPLFVLGGHNGGVTWLKYSSYNTDNLTLFSGARMDDKILQWDMRNYQEPVKTFERKVKTNQRICFDLSATQKWLISGDTSGSIRVWDMDDKDESFEVCLHSDCCNGVSFHPFLPILSTSSGQYHFLDKEVEESSKENPYVVNYENSAMISWFGAIKSP